MNFSKDIKKIKDEKETFINLDLDKNKETVSTEIKKALLDTKAVKATDKIDYIGYIDDYSSYFSNKSYKERFKGTILFLYKINKTQTKNIRYNNYEFEWQIGEYTEEEIKQK